LEPEVAAFLKRIITTIFLSLFWMCISSTAGIMFGYAFVDANIQIANIIFYVWLLISFPLLFWYIRKIWSKKIDFDR